MNRKKLLIPVCCSIFPFALYAGTFVVTPDESYNTQEVREIAFESNDQLTVSFTDGTVRSYDLSSFQRIYFTEGNLSEVPSSLEEKEMYLYPNPVSERLYVTGVAEHSPYEIFNTQGGKVLSGQSSSSVIEISLPSLPNGIYFMSIEGKVLKFIKK